LIGMTGLQLSLTATTHLIAQCFSATSRETNTYSKYSAVELRDQHLEGKESGWLRPAVVRVRVSGSRTENVRKTSKKDRVSGVTCVCRPDPERKRDIFPVGRHHKQCDQHETIRSRWLGRGSRPFIVLFRGHSENAKTCSLFGGGKIWIERRDSSRL